MTEQAAVARLPITVPRPASTPRTRVVLREVGRTQAVCSNCAVSDQCLSQSLDPITSRQAVELVSTRIRLSKGETLYRPGAPFLALYAVHSGSLKSVLLAEDGSDQVMGYHMPGDLVGFGPAQLSSVSFARDCAAGERHAIPGNDARRTALSFFLPRSIATLSGARLFALGVRPANDARRDWQLSWPSTRDHKPSHGPLSG